MSPANVKYVLEHNPEVSSDKVEIAPNSYDVPQGNGEGSEGREGRESIEGRERNMGCLRIDLYLYTGGIWGNQYPDYSDIKVGDVIMPQTLTSKNRCQTIAKALAMKL